MAQHGPSGGVGQEIGHCRWSCEDDLGVACQGGLSQALRLYSSFDKLKTLFMRCMVFYT